MRNNSFSLLLQRASRQRSFEYYPNWRWLRSIKLNFREKNNCLNTQLEKLAFYSKCNTKKKIFQGNSNRNCVSLLLSKLIFVEDLDSKFWPSEAAPWHRGRTFTLRSAIYFRGRGRHSGQVSQIKVPSEIFIELTV